MRLLTKSQVQQAKATERKRDIDEGLHIAKKIDELRELAAKEEADLHRYRVETLAAIQAELAPAKAELDTLLHQVAVAKRERDEALQAVEPLIEQAKRELEEAILKRKEAEELTTRLRAESEALSANTIATAAELKNAKGMSEAARELLIEASHKQIAANALLEQATLEKEEAAKVTQETNTQLNARENLLNEREKSIILSEERLTLQQTEADKLKRQLEDQRRTLERAFNRLKK